MGEFSLVNLVGGTGIEPVTSSVSGKLVQSTSCIYQVPSCGVVAAGRWLSF